jgi:hypothetical protein
MNSSRKNITKLVLTFKDFFWTFEFQKIKAICSKRFHSLPEVQSALCAYHGNRTHVSFLFIKFVRSKLHIVERSYKFSKNNHSAPDSSAAGKYHGHL